MLNFIPNQDDWQYVVLMCRMLHHFYCTNISFQETHFEGLWYLPRQ